MKRVWNHDKVKKVSALREKSFVLKRTCIETYGLFCRKMPYLSSSELWHPCGSDEGLFNHVHTANPPAGANINETRKKGDNEENNDTEERKQGENGRPERVRR